MVFFSLFMFGFWLPHDCTFYKFVGGLHVEIILMVGKLYLQERIVHCYTVCRIRTWKVGRDNFFVKSLFKIIRKLVFYVKVSRRF